MEARGAAPDVFIQDADVAVNAAAQKVFPQAKKRRCLLRLAQGVTKSMKRLLGEKFNVSHYCTVHRITRNITHLTPPRGRSFRAVFSKTHTQNENDEMMALDVSTFAPSPLSRGAASNKVRGVLGCEVSDAGSEASWCHSWFSS